MNYLVVEIDKLHCHVTDAKGNVIASIESYTDEPLPMLERAFNVAEGLTLIDLLIDDTAVFVSDSFTGRYAWRDHEGAWKVTGSEKMKYDGQDVNAAMRILQEDVP